MKDASVHCVITSPPYFNLRDYGTARWTGGSPDCDHKPGSESRVGKTTLEGDTATAGHKQEGYRGSCPKCGAVRIDDQIGLEPTPTEYVESIVAVGREIWRVLREDGCFWLNVGDSYAQSGMGGDPAEREYRKQATNIGSLISGRKAPDGLKPKDLCMIPARVALALQSDGWYLRSMSPWLKRSSMPESCRDRPTSAVEYIFLLSKQERYFYDSDAIRKDGSGLTGGGFSRSYAEQQPGHDAMRLERPQVVGRNRRNSDWYFESLGMITDDDGLPVGFDVTPHGYKGAHYATFPPALVEPMLLSGTSAKGICPRCGAQWERVTALGNVQTRGGGNGRENSGMCRVGNRGDSNVGKMEQREHLTTGWRPSCSCPPAEPVPAICLDPFTGSGTVGEVARLHGRRFVGLDLSMVYLRENALPRAENSQTNDSIKTLPLWGGISG